MQHRAPRRDDDDAAGPPRYGVGEVIGGRYRVYKQSHGGLGDVYFCLDLTDDFPIALKTPRPRHRTTPIKAERLLRRFEDEVRVWAALGKHPNVVRCYYLTVVDELPFACMEWISDPGRSGASLGNLIHREGPLPLRRTIEIAIEVCRGLLHATASHPGFVHRDLKPDNVLVTSDGTAKVSDFGFAQRDASLLQGEVAERARSNTIVGTPHYMAPEQWKRGLVDARADVYAMGIMLYEALTKERLWDGLDTREEWEKAHQNDAPPHLPCSLPGEADQIVQRCLAKAPGERFGGIEELHEALIGLYECLFGESPAPPLAGDALTVEDENNLGNTYSNLGEAELAVAAYDRCLELDPEFAAARYGRGIALAAKDDHGEAVREYTRALELNPGRADVLYNRANSYAALGRERFAIADYDAALECEPTLVEAVHNRALVHVHAGRSAQAFTDLATAIEMAGLPNAYRTRATLLLEQGRDAEALADIDAAISGEPPGAAADRLIRARLHSRLGDHRRAIIDFNAAIDGDFALADAFSWRGASYAARGEHEAALRDFTLALRHDRNAIQPLRRRAALLRDLERWDQAMADYLELSEREPEDAGVLYELGLMFGMRDDAQQALEYVRRSAELGHATARATLRRFEPAASGKGEAAR